MSQVCSKCFADLDIAAHIEGADGEPGCDYCGQDDAATIDMDDLSEFLIGRLGQEYGSAVNQLPYDGREGGFQGWHADSYEMIYDRETIELARFSEALLDDLVYAIGADEIWAEWDWLSLDPHAAMSFSWLHFTEIVKHTRHFFFTKVLGDVEDRDHIDPLSLMTGIAAISEQVGLIKTLPAGTKLYRARARQPGKTWASVEDLGPPPAALMTQFNRMNAPGVPVMYASDSRALAITEVGNIDASIGTWRALRDLRILDLFELPDRPGLFSPLDREERLGLRFLIEFAKTISQPVAGTDAVKLDYIPTQVVTEFFRDYSFKAGGIDGVRYRAANGGGANVVLFADQKSLSVASSDRMLELSEVEQYDSL